MIKSGKDTIFAAKLIREGKLVAFPTETVYGLGANGLDANAVASVFEAKKRPSFDPLILHISSTDDLSVIFKKPADIIYQLADKYWPGPLTIVAKKTAKVPDIVTAGLETAAVRMPNHPVALKLIRQSKVPVAAPSANIFGRLSPTKPQHVKEQLKTIDYLLEGGKTDLGIESTIVSVKDAKTIEVLRPGAITIDTLQKDFPHIDFITGSGGDSLTAPGQLKSHYSPRKPLYLYDELPSELPSYAALILFKPYNIPSDAQSKVVLLSKTGDIKEAASNMFGALHSLEGDSEIEQIYAVKIKEEGLGIAVMDRLKKAAYRFTNFYNDHEIEAG
ncbi:L-threonylcarbamoyladenylate synthase [Marinilabiliaceae bacterium ANBcel2]|nr:L-threonylcarbamoyladenylate synthase [Marinilabiliaceae bacterium ANBcel2]